MDFSYHKFKWYKLLCSVSWSFHTLLVGLSFAQKKCSSLKISPFLSYVKTQFQTQIKSFQCDNGGDYQNKQFQSFLDENSIMAGYSCPHTSQQNGKSERMIQTINNDVRALLFQAKLAPTYWVEALHVAVHVLNITSFFSYQKSDTIHPSLPKATYLWPSQGLWLLVLPKFKPLKSS